MEKLKTDICVLGAGSGGLVAASVAAQFGVKVALIENRQMGGECLNYGCVPSKSLIAAAKVGNILRRASEFGFEINFFSANYKKIYEHVRSVIEAIKPHDSVERFEQLGVNVLLGEAEFISESELRFENKIISSRYFVIATGSSPALPPVSGLDKIDYLTNETIFDLKEKPEHLIVIGGGPVGCELAQAHRLLGAQVTILQRSKILPKDDEDFVEIVRKRFVKDGIVLYEEILIESAQRENDKIKIVVKKDEQEIVIEGSHLLVATGRKPNIKKLHLEKAKVTFDKTGILIDSRMRTSNKRIFAIGDVAKGYKFTHIAGYQAGVVIQNALFKLPTHGHYATLPWVTYTTPQLAHVGLTEKEACEKHKEIRILIKPFEENDRAQAEKDTSGFIKVITTSGGKVLGVSIVGDNVDNLLGVWSLVISQNLPIKSVANLIVPYPTRGEINKAVASEFYKPFLTSRWVRRIVNFLKRF